MTKAYITGGTRGIGLAIAGYLRKYYDVVSIGRGPDNDICADLTVNSGGLITEPVDVLVNNAGFQFLSPAVDYPLEQWHRQMAMMTAYFDLARQAYTHGARRIINISSIVGMRGARGTVGYSVAKAGIIEMTKCLASEWGEHCTVNCIVPGYVETDMLKCAFRDEAQRQMVMNLVPEKRFGLPRDFIPVVDCLLKADYINGAVIVVDGGFTQR